MIFSKEVSLRATGQQGSYLFPNCINTYI
ncbi:uncharacterized protein METZ01_LOCUS235946, partial [marine metagenome]